jgi:photosystem II stability/assembly factor-like uncharacterized protein
MVGLGMTAGLMLLAMWVAIVLLIVQHPKVSAGPATLMPKCSISGSPGVMLGNGPTFEIMDVAAATPCRVWAVGQTVKGANTTGIVLFRSDDAANQFRRTSFGVVGDNPLRVAFAPDGSAWIVGGHFPGGLPKPMVLHSSNGGDQWKEITLPVTAGPMQGISFSNDKIWVWGYAYATDFRPGVSNPDCVVLVSSDGGRTWSEKMSLHQVAGHQPFIGPVAAGGETVMVLGREADKDLLWSSSDGGQTFTRINLGFLASHLSVVGPDTAYAVSPPCTPPCNPDVLNLLETADGGRTWRPVETVWRDLLDLRFIARDVGFAIIFGMTVQTLGLYQTTDYGHSWQHVSDLPFDSGLAIGPSRPAAGTCQDSAHQLDCVEDAFRGFILGPNGLILTYGSQTIHRLALLPAAPAPGSK